MEIGGWIIPIWSLAVSGFAALVSFGFMAWVLWALSGESGAAIRRMRAAGAMRRASRRRRPPVLLGPTNRLGDELPKRP